MIAPHLFDTIVTDRPLTHDLFGAVTRKWRVIYADPAWSFTNWSEDGMDRNPAQHYDTMSIEEIKAMPVADIADDDCALAMWTTDPLLNRAIEVMEAWGFEYKTVLFYWAKTWPAAELEEMHETKSFPIGTGYLTRANPEMILLGTKGNPKRKLFMNKGEMKPDMSIRRLQFAPRGMHSEKPEKFATLIERIWEGPYLELNSRKTRPGWGAWGNQVGLLDDGPVKTKREKPLRVPPPNPLFDGIPITI